jgi:predicted TIM-barrel fold metal-dependent hydrolase
LAAKLGIEMKEDAIMAQQADSAGQDLCGVGGGQRIDVHQHVILPEYVKALRRSGVADASLPRRTSESTVVCDTMAGLGIAATLLNPVTTAGIHHGNDANARYLTETTNDALAKFVMAAPNKFGFFAILPVPDVDGALAQLEYVFDSLHADGLFFFSSQNGVYLGDLRLEPLYAEMDRRGVVAFVHPASPAYVVQLGMKLFAACIEYPFETTRVAANLIYNGVMAKYPNIKWILAHGGGAVPYLSYRLRLMEHDDREEPVFNVRVPGGVTPFLDRFYYDLALVGAPAPLAALAAMADPARLLYGTDCPFIGKSQIGEQLLNMQASPHLSEGRLQMVERDNVLRLFGRFA